jgi:DNA-binding MarR family transcriptional regulator
VKRRRSTTDRRKYELSVTARGRANLKKIARLIPLHEQWLFGRFSVRERAALYRALRRLIDESEAPGR